MIACFIRNSIYKSRKKIFNFLFSQTDSVGAEEQVQGHGSRRGVRIPTEESGSQRTRSSHAGHQKEADRAGNEEPGSLASSTRYEFEIKLIIFVMSKNVINIFFA